MGYILNMEKGTKDMTQYTNETIKTLLSKGYHKVTFAKKTGEVVIRNLTRDPDIMPAFIPKTDQIRVQSEKTVRAWDGDNHKFCAVIAQNVKEVA